MGNKTMYIQVLGSGCPTCKKLFELTKQAVEELGLTTEVEYITDIQRIVEMGVMQSPILAINGKPIIIGSIPGIDKIKEVIIENSNDPDLSGEQSGCHCGGTC